MGLGSLRYYKSVVKAEPHSILPGAKPLPTPAMF